MRFLFLGSTIFSLWNELSTRREGAKERVTRMESQIDTYKERERECVCVCVRDGLYDVRNRSMRSATTRR